jgi:hypothetical protein
MLALTLSYIAVPMISLYIGHNVGFYNNCLLQAQLLTTIGQASLDCDSPGICLEYAV